MEKMGGVLFKLFALLTLLLHFATGEEVFQSRKTVEDAIREYNNTYAKRHEEIKPEVQNSRPKQTTIIVIAPGMQPQHDTGRSIMYTNQSMCFLDEEQDSWFAIIRRIDWAAVASKAYDDVSFVLSRIEFIHIMTILAIISAYVIKPVEVLREQHLVTHIR